MAREGLVRLAQVNGSATVEWVGQAPLPEATEESPKEPLSDHDFEILDHLEDTEAWRINFGIYEGWTSLPELAASLEAPRGRISDALRRLQSHGHLLVDEEGRIRSRMAEVAREYATSSSGSRWAMPTAVPSWSVPSRWNCETAIKPVRDQPLSAVLETVQTAIGDDPTAHRVLQGLEAMLQRHWNHEDPPLAGFQARALRAIFSAWLDRSTETSFVITADTGVGKTEAACLPLIAGAAPDRLRGLQGTRALLVYPRVRLAANQAQRITGYLAALRTRLFDDDPGANRPRRECCGQPATCDRFRQGECRYFSATDSDQVTARGHYRPGSALTISERPVYSGEKGNVEEMIRRSDLVFATPSLAVGYDDPDIALVYQHYAPSNLASFIQR